MDKQIEGVGKIVEHNRRARLDSTVTVVILVRRARRRRPKLVDLPPPTKTSAVRKPDGVPKGKRDQARARMVKHIAMHARHARRQLQLMVVRPCLRLAGQSLAYYAMQLAIYSEIIAGPASAYFSPG